MVVPPLAHSSRIGTPTSSLRTTENKQTVIPCKWNIYIFGTWRRYLKTHTRPVRWNLLLRKALLLFCAIWCFCVVLLLKFVLAFFCLFFFVLVLLFRWIITWSIQRKLCLRVCFGVEGVSMLLVFVVWKYSFLTLLQFVTNMRNGRQLKFEISVCKLVNRLKTKMLVMSYM